MLIDFLETMQLGQVWRQAITTEFFDATRPLHLVNIFSQNESVPTWLQQDLGYQSKCIYRENANRLAGILTHYLSQAILLNTDGQPHKDVQGAWCGFDCVAMMGRHQGGTLSFPDLGSSFPSKPGDLFFLALLGWSNHQCSLHIFLKEAVHRPKDVHPVYGRVHAQFRGIHPHISWCETELDLSIIRTIPISGFHCWGRRKVDTFHASWYWMHAFLQHEGPSYWDQQHRRDYLSKFWLHWLHISNWLEGWCWSSFVFSNTFYSLQKKFPPNLKWWTKSLDSSMPFEEYSSHPPRYCWQQCWNMYCLELCVMSVENGEACLQKTFKVLISFLWRCSKFSIIYLGNSWTLRPLQSSQTNFKILVKLTQHFWLASCCDDNAACIGNVTICIPVPITFNISTSQHFLVHSLVYQWAPAYSFCLVLLPIKGLGPKFIHSRYNIIWDEGQYCSTWDLWLAGIEAVDHHLSPTGHWSLSSGREACVFTAAIYMPHTIMDTSTHMKLHWWTSPRWLPSPVFMVGKGWWCWPQDLVHSTISWVHSLSIHGSVVKLDIAWQRLWTWT